MQKTTNYQLNKPEADDPIRVADFNQNADIIDAALKSLNTAVGTKAEQSAVNALTTAVASAGNCKIAMGSYTGTGAYGEANPTTLSFDFEPKMVVLWSDEHWPVSTGFTTSLIGYWGPYFTILLPNVTKMRTAEGDMSADWSYLTFSGKSVQVYCGSSAALQWNLSGKAYFYLAIG